VPAPAASLVGLGLCVCWPAGHCTLTRVQPWSCVRHGRRSYAHRDNIYSRYFSLHRLEDDGLALGSACGWQTHPARKCVQTNARLALKCTERCLERLTRLDRKPHAKPWGANWPDKRREHNKRNEIMTGERRALSSLTGRGERRALESCKQAQEGPAGGPCRLLRRARRTPFAGRAHA